MADGLIGSHKQEALLKKCDDAVAELFAAYPKRLRAKLLLLRELIFRTTARTAALGRLEETLKWGQPS